MITSALNKCSKVSQQAQRFAGNYLWLLRFLFPHTWLAFLKVVCLNLLGAGFQVASVLVLVLGIRRMESDTPTGIGFLDPLLADSSTRILVLGSAIFIFLTLDACVAYLFAIKMRALGRWVHQHIVSHTLKIFSRSTSLTHQTLPDSPSLTMQSISRDSLHVSNAFEALVRMTEPGIRAAVAVCLLFWIDTWLAFLVVVSLLLFAPVLHLVGSSTHHNSQTFFSTSSGEMAQGLQGTLNQVRQISYVADPVRTQAIDQAYWEKPQIRNYFDHFDQYRLAQFRSRFFASLVKTISLVLAFGGGAYLVSQGRLSWPVVAGFLVAGREAASRFQALSGSVTRLTIFYGAVIRFRSIADPLYSKVIDSNGQAEPLDRNLYESVTLTVSSDTPWPDSETELALERGKPICYLSDCLLDRGNIGHFSAPLRPFFSLSDPEWNQAVGFVGSGAVLNCGTLAEHLWGKEHTEEKEQQFFKLVESLNFTEQYDRFPDGLQTAFHSQLWNTFSRPFQTFLLMFPLFHDDNLVVFLDYSLLTGVGKDVAVSLLEQLSNCIVFIVVKKPATYPVWMEQTVVTQQGLIQGLGSRLWLGGCTGFWTEQAQSHYFGDHSVNETELLDVM